MVMKKKTRAKIVRKARTENDIKTMMSKYGPDPFLVNENKFNKSLFRTIFKFKRDFNKVCEKYGIVFGSTSFNGVLDVISHEINPWKADQLILNRTKK